MREEAIKLLKERDLKVTSPRLSTLSILLADQSKAYSTSELVKFLESQMNRSTVYRTLDTLLEKEVILTLQGTNGTTFYTLNLENKCATAVHPHLRCTECGKVECLPAFPTDYVNSLHDSGVGKLDIVLGGICSECSKDSKMD